MNRELAAYFCEEVSKKLTFLVTEHNFNPPQFEIDESIKFTFVIFSGKNLAIEFILDEREFDIDCKISFVIQNKKTPHYEVNTSGVPVREGLASLLRRRGIKEKFFKKIDGLDFNEQIKVTLDDFANMLSRFGQSILADSTSALL